MTVFHIIMVFPSFISNQPTRVKHKGSSPSLNTDTAHTTSDRHQGIADGHGSAWAKQGQQHTASARVHYLLQSTLGTHSQALKSRYSLYRCPICSL